MYTKEALENRLVELDEMNEELSVLSEGFVGGAEIDEMNRIMERYDFDQDDWFSDRFEIELVLGDMEVAGV